jgi:hypothetical protein
VVTTEPFDASFDRVPQPTPDCCSWRVYVSDLSVEGSAVAKALLGTRREPECTAFRDRTVLANPGHNRAMRRCDFHFGSDSVNVTFESATVKSGLECLVLSFRTSMSATWLTADSDNASTPMLVTGNLTTPPHELWTIGQVAAQIVMLRGKPAQEHFDVTITADQALAIEGRRQDADPSFYLGWEPRSAQN